MNNRILVIGASGQVAMSLKDIATNNFIFAGRPELDIQNKDNIRNLIEAIAPELIVNAAAYTAVDLAETESDISYCVNGHSLKNLAQICQQHNIPLIHLSTDYVFDGKSKTPYKENDPTNPLSVYGKSKLLGENNIREQLDKHIIIRTTWVFSKYGNNFVKTMLRLAKSAPELKIIDDQIGCPTSAHNIAKVIVKIATQILLDKDNLTYGTYHYTDAPVTSWYGFANEIFTILARDYKHKTPIVTAIPTTEYKTAAIRPLYSVLNCNLLKSNFGIGQENWQQDLIKTIEYNIN